MPAMITTLLAPSSPAVVVHCVSGAIEPEEAALGADAALRCVQHASALHGPLGLVLDMRAAEFRSLAAHRAWSLGFARNPALQAHVHSVAIVAGDTPQLRAEQQLLETERVKFFIDLAAAEAWLAQARPEIRG